MRYPIIAFMILFSCQNKNNITLKPVVSNESVFMKANYRHPEKDSIILDLPLEYKIINNSSKEIDNSDILITHNGHSLSYLDDFIVFDKNQYYSNNFLETKKKIKQKEQLHIIIRENYIYISKKEAYQILKKYNIDQNLLKTTKAVKIVNFNKFIIENPEIMNEINKSNDSILLSNFNKGTLIFINRKKINW
ncbi:hypothetical protein [Flavobacterium aquidurense]|uniref:hypothetical protein n=1 Tax=Flavobacterium aquidurense TaxID=362413 RepID=UPI002865AC5D|nr:hypothetical protein [Flavobacterium aquidurense]MDR7371013.1 hypothetical protein [Flavobacterium aquidurense]